MAEFELKALITGVDRLSPALSKMQKKIRGFKRQAEEASQGGLALGGGLAAGLTLSLKSYAFFFRRHRAESRHDGCERRGWKELSGHQ
ncbi:putative phage tail protein [Escherichia coli SHECO002]|nr:putative phage tail protein [Escherichia coli SHECO002]